MDSEDEEWLKAFNKKKVRLIHHAHFSQSAHTDCIFLLVYLCNKPVVVGRILEDPGNHKLTLSTVHEKLIEIHVLLLEIATSSHYFLSWRIPSTFYFSFPNSFL